MVHRSRRWPLLLGTLVLGFASLAWLFPAEIDAMRKEAIRFFGQISNLTIDREKPFSLRDDFVLNIWSNVIVLILQIAASYFVIKYVISRRERYLLFKTRLWLASKLRDELFVAVVSSKRNPRRATANRARQLSQRATSFLDPSGWSSCLRLEAALESFLSHPDDNYYFSSVRGRFADLLDALELTGSRKEIYLDRLDVAFKFR